MDTITGAFFIQHCLVCDDHRAFWPTEEQAQDAAVWHVYENHRATWIAVIGEDRPPRNPDPRKEA